MHNEIHFFLDESGEFDSTRYEMLVGGVLLFGPYNQQVESELRTAFVDSLAEIDRKYPNDLHFADFGPNDAESGQRFTSSLNQRLDQWRKDTDRTVYGVLIRHQHDVYAESPSLLAERELDNRYIAMLWALIEHFVFVNEIETETSKHSPDARQDSRPAGSNQCSAFWNIVPFQEHYRKSWHRKCYRS